MTMRKRAGITFIDLIISMGIIALLFSAIFALYFSIVNSANNIEVRTAAAELMTQQIETIRNLPYDSVGLVASIPSGVIPENQTLSIGKYSFTLTTVVRNIDDPFDGTLGGAPNDTNPADYKLVTLTASCPSCPNGFVPLSETTTVAPKNLEASGLSGSLFINVLDARGVGVPFANVLVSNATVTPSISLTDTTNASGVLQLVGVPTSTQSYHVVVTKSGYSSDQTYQPGLAANPHPVKPDATVAQQSVTSVSFLIDRTSVANISTQGLACDAQQNIRFSTQGAKYIGTNPTIYKFSTSSQTNASGTFTFPTIEWDTYYFAMTQSGYDLLGTIPLSPVALDPGSTLNFQFIVAPAADPALLVTAMDLATGAGIQNATVAISKPGFSATMTTGHATATHTDWSGSNAYASQSGGIDTTSVPGRLTLLLNASGTYDTGTTEWLISKTIDLGSNSASLSSFSWNPGSQSGGTTVHFQIAVNNDNATWNFVGPDGTGDTYYDSATSLAGSFDNKRYVRYKIFMSTLNENNTPKLNDITFDWTGGCVPPAQALFTGLPTGTYTVDVTAQNYLEATSSAVVGGGFNQASTTFLTHS